MPDTTPSPTLADSAPTRRPIYRRMVAGLAALATALSLFTVDAAPARAAGRDDDMVKALIALGVVGIIAHEIDRDKKRDRNRDRDRDRRAQREWHQPGPSRQDAWDRGYRQRPDPWAYGYYDQRQPRYAHPRYSDPHRNRWNHRER